jgi:hypothetical protein
MMIGKRVWVRVLGLLLAALQVYPLTAMQSAPVPLSVAAQEVAEQVKKIPPGGKLTVQMGNGSEYHGRLLSIGDEEFSIREVDLKQDLAIRYSDVNRVRKNYGGKGLGGKRVDPKRNLIVGATLFGTLMIILAVALAKDKS